MKKKTKKIKYTDEPMDFEIIEDFLPPPSQLILKSIPKMVKVTLDLEKNSIETFKKIAKKRHIPYQKMIQTLVHLYATKLHP